MNIKTTFSEAKEDTTTGLLGVYALGKFSIEYLLGLAIKGTNKHRAKKAKEYREQQDMPFMRRLHELYTPSGLNLGETPAQHSIRTDKVAKAYDYILGMRQANKHKIMLSDLSDDQLLRLAEIEESAKKEQWLGSNNTVHPLPVSIQQRIKTLTPA